MSVSMIAQIKVVLDHVKPVVMRRLEIPLAIKLDRLHTTLQIAMGWTDSHLYEFQFRGTSFGIPDPRGGFHDGPLDARKSKLVEVFTDTGTKSFKYIYDFGDGWEHTIKIEKTGRAIEGLDYPFLLEATGRCPPEDVGGPWGYQEAREAVLNPNHERHEEFEDWWGIDPNEIDKVDIQGIEARLNGLAKHWAKKPSVKQK